MGKSWYIRALIPSIIFNLRNLPLRQALKLPIVVYKLRTVKNSGKIRICGPLKPGMIKLGVNAVSLFPNSGLMLENRGTIVFNGRATIGNSSSISLGSHGVLEFGKNFAATAGLKLACYHSIRFGDNVLVGWDTLVTDTDFHVLKSVTGEGGSKGFGPISVGHDVWIANGCKLYKNATIPDYCVVGADTCLYKPVNCEPYSLITNKREMEIRTTGKYRDRDNDRIEFK